MDFRMIISILLFFGLSTIIKAENEVSELPIESIIEQNDPCLIYSEIKNIGCNDLVIYKVALDGTENYYCTVSPRQQYQIYFDHNFSFAFYADDEMLKEWVPEDCDDLNLSFDTRGCSIGCEDGTITFHNNSDCESKVLLGGDDTFTILPNQVISKPMNKSWKWVVQSSAVQGYRTSHSYRVGCKEVVNIYGSCPPDCQPSLSITNDGDCDGVAILNKVARLIIPAGSTETFNTEDGWTWDIITVEERVVIADYKTNYDCNQSISFDVHCVLPDSGTNDNEGSLDCAVFSDDSFENGWGHMWIDGGIDCYRINNAGYASEGSYSIRLRDNSYQKSSMYTHALDFRNVAKVKIDFSFSIKSFEVGESLILEYSTENGANYTTAYTWTSDDGNDFSDRVSVTIEEEFSLETRFRIRSHASTNSDQVFIDQVTIETCEYSNNIIAEDEPPVQAKSRSKNQKPIISTDVRIYPTLVDDTAIIEYDANSTLTMTYSITDINGAVLVQEALSANDNYHTIDMSTYTTGMYVITTYSNNQIVKTQKIIKQ